VSEAVARRGLASWMLLWSCAALSVGCTRAAGAPNDSSAAAERERARRTAARIEAEWPLVGTGPVAAFVRSLGADLGKTPSAAAERWSFVLVRDRAVNAYAIGAGRIYVTEGAVSECANEAELAAILAHEMGHQLAGHFRRPGRRDAAAMGLGSVTQPIDARQEQEADRFSVRILREAGYDPHPSLDLARRMARSNPNAGRHFAAAGRLAALEDLLRTMPSTGKRDSPAFQELVRDPSGRR
jgi:predicted Zn-dependent protease